MSSLILVENHVPFTFSSSRSAYLAATATSVLIAVSLTRAVPRLPFTPTTKSLLAKLVPFVSVASAGVVNISCIRWKEMRDGVEVFRIIKNPEDDSEEKEVLGKSPTAGKYAVAQSAASRVFTNIPTLIIPPMVMTALEAKGVFVGPRGKYLSTLTNLTLSECTVTAPRLTYILLSLGFFPCPL